MSLTKFKNDPKTKFLANRFEKTVSIALEKVAGHLRDPQEYPLPADANSVERTVYNLLLAVPERKRDKFIDKYKGNLQASSTKRQQLYGDLAAIDIRATASVNEQVKKIVVPASKKISEADSVRLRSYFTTKPVTPANPKKTITAKLKQPAQVVTPGGKLVFNLLSLTCDKTSEVRKDEISVAGFAIDSLGVTQEKAPFFAGDFKKGDTIPFDVNTGQLFSFDIAPDSTGIVFPLSTTVGLFLVEKDLVGDKENKLSKVFFALSLLMTTIAGVIVTVGIAGGPFSLAAWIICMSLSMLFGFVAGNIIPLMTDDVSSEAVDVLVLEAPANIGEQFNRTLSFELFNLRQGLLDGKPGKYTANIRWEVF
jgi:hypothetical protein